METRGLALLVVVLLTACGGDDGGSGSAPPKSGDAPPASKPDDAPPTTKPTGRPALTEADFVKLSSRTLAGYTGSVGRASKHRLTMTFVRDEKTPSGVKVVVMVTIQPCDVSACFSMDPTHAMNAQWAKQARESLEKQGYADPVFEVGTFRLAPGYDGFMHFQLGYKEEVREGDLKSKSSTHAFHVRYHDGANAIALRVFKQGQVEIESAADLEQAMPRASAEDAARKVFGLYADLFEKGGR